jgi:hypothetical protein
MTLVYLKAYNIFHFSFCRKNYQNHLWSNNYDICTAATFWILSTRILDVMVLDCITIIVCSWQEFKSVSLDLHVHTLYKSSAKPLTMSSNIYKLKYDVNIFNNVSNNSITSYDFWLKQLSWKFINYRWNTYQTQSIFFRIDPVINTRLDFFIICSYTRVTVL